MLHTPYIRMVPNADTAVLFVHGICGTPRHFDFLSSRVPHNVSVVNVLLEGHGGDVRAFSRASMTAWEMQIRDTADMLLEKHRQLYIVGHSMGTLLAMENALRCPDKTAGMLLLAAPLRIAPKMSAMVNAVKVGMDWIKPGDTWAEAARQACGLNADRHIWRYLGWIPRYLELFALAREMRKVLPSLHTPCRVFQSMEDELVSVRSCDDLKKAPGVRLECLEHSRHYGLTDADRARVEQAFDEMLMKA